MRSIFSLHCTNRKMLLHDDLLDLYLLAYIITKAERLNPIYNRTKNQCKKILIFTSSYLYI